MTDSALKVGQLIQLDDGRTGTVRFIGQTSFKEGEWIGVELEEATGKNDGLVQGERYFKCDMGKGLFCQAPKVEAVLREPEPVVSKTKEKSGATLATAKTAPGKTTAASSATSKRTSMVGAPGPAKSQGIMSNGLKRPGLGSKDPTAARRQTLNEASPTPGPRTGTAATGTKASPLKSAARTSSTTPSRSVTSPTAARKPATKPSTNSTSRPSISAGSSKPPTTTSSTTASKTNRMSISGGPSTTRTPATASKLSQKPPPRASTATAALKHSPSASRAINGTATQGRSKLSQESNRQRTEDTDLESTTAETNEPPKEGEGENEEEDDDKELNEGVTMDEDNQEEAAQEEAEEQKPTPRASPVKATAKASATAAPPSRAATAIAGKREEELQRKLQSLEKRHAEDREQLGVLEKIKSERDKFENIIQQLQNKYRPQAQKLADTEKKLKESEDKLAEIETIQAEHDSAMEMATLDREVAEETAEALREQHDELKLRVEELELELETTRHENEELGTEMSPEERASKGWMSMSNENSRLRAALIRLRDMTREKEADLNKQISELEEDLQKFDGLQAQYDETKQRLEQTEADMAELKEQLEAAGGTEDMMEELTEKNLGLNEQVAELQLEIEQLEDLRDLNDEMELAHVENEKQMQDELDHRDSLLVEHNRAAEQQATRVSEYEYTISKFRDLVAGLQGHIDDLKASQQLTEAETEELTGRSKAIMDLNVKLQESATKTQIKSVDLELGKLEAQEAVEHFDIVKLFLPEAYHAEKDSILTYLRFKRVGFKANLLYNAFKERFSPNNHFLTPDNAFVSCDIMDKLCWIFAMCERFVGDIKGCTLERFANYGSALHELDSVERGMNSFVDAWKSNDIKETSMADQLQRSKLLLAHFAETHIEDSLENYADEIRMRTVVIQAYLETTLNALSYIDAMVGKASARNEADDDENVETESETLNEFRDALHKSLSQCRSGRVVINKATSALEELRERAMTLNVDTRDTFEKSLQAMADVPAIVRELGECLRSALEEATSDDFAIENALRMSLGNLRSSGLLTSQDCNALSSLSSKVAGSISTLSTLQSLSTDLSLTVEFQRLPAPWTVRSEALANTSLTTQTTTEENARLKESVQQRTTELRVRDERIEEQTVKIELLESRMRDANAKANKITELQTQVDAGRKREKELTDAIESQLRSTSTLQVERDRWKAMADEAIAKTQSSNNEDQEEETGEEKSVQAAKRRSLQPNAASVRELDTLRLEIKDLQGAVRHLRSDNQRVLFSDPATSSHMTWLSRPLVSSSLSKDSKEAQDNLSRETTDVFADLMALVNRSEIVDLSKIPENKLSWRPAREKSSWIVAANREEWEGWCKRRDNAIKRGTETLGPRILRRLEKRSTAKGVDSSPPKANGSIQAKGRGSKPSHRPRTPDTITTENTDATSAVSSMPPSPTSSSKQASSPNLPQYQFRRRESRSSQHSNDFSSFQNPQQATEDIPSSVAKITNEKVIQNTNEPDLSIQSSRSASPEDTKPLPVPGAYSSPEKVMREPTSPTATSTSPSSARKQRPKASKRVSIGYRLPMGDEG